jgi:ABC-2 type transport system ATP-binding protein
MADDIVIRVDNVSKDFLLPHEKVNSIKSLFTSVAKGRNKGKETQHALKNISLEIKKGEFFGIVGRNGSGKSTLLKIMAGIYQPNSGTVHTQGKLVPFIELGVGFNPELTGRENIYLNGALLGFSKKEVEAMYDSVVEFAELERFMDQKLKNYSSGMQVRLAFSMAVRAEADILLIDEVLAVGDADFQRKCYDYFKKLKKYNKTVIFVSHDMSAVREYCDKAMLIENNSILTIGSTTKVTQEYTKLFADNHTAATKDKEDNNRWGDQKAKVTDITTDVNQDKIVIYQTVTAIDYIENPIIGFRIRNLAGEEVTGTNTKVEGQKIPSIKANQKIRLIWSLPNVFSNGQYSIDPSILYEDGLTVADWWDDAVSIKVSKPRRLPYAIDPSFKLKIE